MISRTEWQRLRRRRIDALEADAAYHEKQHELALEKLAEIEAQSYEDAMADVAFDEAKQRREGAL